MSKPTFRSGVTPRTHPAATLGAAAPAPEPEQTRPASHPLLTPAAKNVRSTSTKPRPARRAASTDGEAGAKEETPQQFPLWTRVDVAERLRAATFGRRFRFVDLIIERVDTHKDQLAEILQAAKGEERVPSALFGTRRALTDQEPPAMVQVTVQGLLPSQRRAFDQLAARHGVSTSQMVTAVLDHSLPKGS